MDRDHTFDLPDLTEDFWKTVVFAQKEHPSGMGGPGCVWLVSEDGKVYFFGFEETPFYKCDELFPIFETTDERIGWHYKYKAEDHGWKYLEKENALIREDILDAYSKAAAEEKQTNEKFWYLYGPKLAGLAIGVDHLERYDYIGSVLYMEKIEQEMAEHQKTWEKDKLTENEFDWKPMHMNNIPDNPEMGVYALLMRRDDEKIKGVKYSILYQYEESSPMLFDSDAEIEAYILFCEDYDDISVRGTIIPSADRNVQRFTEKKIISQQSWHIMTGLRFQMVIFITSADFSAHSKVWKKPKNTRCIMPT